MTDKLSNLAMLVLHSSPIEGDLLCVDEVCISCRALGRKIEGVLIETAIKKALEIFNLTAFKIRFVEGPRNAPAKSWLMDNFALKNNCQLDESRYSPADFKHGEITGYVGISWNDE